MRLYITHLNRLSPIYSAEAEASADHAPVPVVVTLLVALMSLLRDAQLMNKRIDTYFMPLAAFATTSGEVACKYVYSMLYSMYDVCTVCTCICLYSMYSCLVHLLALSFVFSVCYFLFLFMQRGIYFFSPSLSFSSLLSAFISSFFPSFQIFYIYCVYLVY